MIRNEITEHQTLVANGGSDVRSATSHFSLKVKIQRGPI